jgi:hypothetical protein
MTARMNDNAMKRQFDLGASYSQVFHVVHNSYKACQIRRLFWCVMWLKTMKCWRNCAKFESF